MAEFVERRRSPRLGVRSCTLTLVSSTPVKLLDISLGGALMSCEQLVEADRSFLRLSLAGGRFSSSIRLRHVQPTLKEGTRIGGAFLEMNIESRQSLEEFLARATR